ncbi:hypothetical protein GJAV_G00023750 [Gymnothorax javanicus]|nr:hypothetical protein GJAV_G00023750 [Gymnothorax javanicus]
MLPLPPPGTAVSISEDPAAAQRPLQTELEQHTLETHSDGISASWDCPGREGEGERKLIQPQFLNFHLPFLHLDKQAVNDDNQEAWCSLSGNQSHLIHGHPAEPCKDFKILLHNRAEP